MANPKNDVLDFQAIAEAAHKHGLPVVCDNTVLTPILLRPFDHGIDIAVYSATKFIGGHGTSIGGVIVDSGQVRLDAESRKNGRSSPSPTPRTTARSSTRRSGSCATSSPAARTGCATWAGAEPVQRFLFLQGLETLHLRMPRHSENALAVARFLESHPLVTWVNYPGPAFASRTIKLAQKYLPKGAGAILGFGIKGGRAAARKFIESVKLASHLANIGDAKTLVIHPASTTHSQQTPEELPAAGVTDDYVRVSVGLEDIEDIKADLDQALKASQK